MIQKKIGIIGVTGRVGSILQNIIINEKKYHLGISFSRNKQETNIVGSEKTDNTVGQVLTNQLDRVFLQNDYVIDFSSGQMIKEVLTNIILNPKPTVICTTGWNREKYLDLLNLAATKTSIIIAPNTSLGACLQLYFSKKLGRQMCKALTKYDDTRSYDIDIIDKHHRYKVDKPSGTALQLSSGITEAIASNELYQEKVNNDSVKSKNNNIENKINIHSIRSGNIFGEHQVIFTNSEEQIQIQHTVFDRKLFAKGAITAIEWLNSYKPKPGIYTMTNVFGLDD